MTTATTRPDSPEMLEARRSLKLQSEVLSRYAAALEAQTTGPGAGNRVLEDRAALARDMAAVMFRAAALEPL